VVESKNSGVSSQLFDEQADIVPNPQNGTDGPVVTQAKSLIETFRQAGSDRLGMWLHIVARDNITATDAGIMPETGQLVRVGPLFEAWYQLDARGYVQAYISFMRAADGTPVQIDTFSEGVGRNLTLDIKSDQQPYPFDQFLTSLISSGWEAETLLQVVEEMYGGQPLIFFTAYTEYDEPTYFEDLQLSVIATELREGYDPITGTRMLAEYIAYTAFGERIVSSINETLLVEWVMQPPEEVLEYLSLEVASE
jgi:hypothetical protein